MKKTGIIHRIHKGLRTWLFETGIVIQETDFLSAAEGAKTVATLRKVLQVAERKSIIDETHLLPALVFQAPFLVSLMDAEIRKTKELIEKLQGYVEGYLQAGTENYYAVTGFSIQQVYSEFMGAVMTYMNRVESMMMELSAAGIQAEEWEKIEAAQLSQIEEANRMFLGEWLFKGLTDREIAEWLGNSEKENRWFTNQLAGIAETRNKSQKDNNRIIRMVAA